MAESGEPEGGLSMHFSQQTINRIADALPKPVRERRREQLPKVLHEWSHTALWKRLDSQETVHTRIGNIDKVRRHAHGLLVALRAAHHDRASIEYEILSVGKA